MVDIKSELLFEVFSKREDLTKWVNTHDRISIVQISESAYVDYSWYNTVKTYTLWYYNNQN